MPSAGYATLSVIPSAKGFGAALSRDIDPLMHASGLSAGKVLAAGLLAGAAVVAVGLAAVIKTGIGEAMDASAGTAQLAAGIKSTGNAANVSVDGLNALASSIQKYSGQTDDSIVASEQLLLTFTNIKNTGTDKIFDLATKATANMAAKMGGDAAGSAILLGKALNDPIKGMASLGRAGVQFTDAQKATIKALVESGDTMGAQKIILAELETQFGGAAEAAGKSLPGQLAIAQRSFEDVSQSVAEGLLPIVLPGLTRIGDTISTRVIPAVSDFVQGFKDGEGAGGKFRDLLKKVNDEGVKPLAAFVKDTALPALASIATWITDTGVPALSKFKDWVVDNKGALEGIATFITITLIPVFADMAVKAVASATTQVGAWVAAQVAAGESAGFQLVSHYTAVAGWVLHADAAIVNTTIIVENWVASKWAAITSAASEVASHALGAGGWITHGVIAVASGAIAVGAWIALKVESVTSAAVEVASHVFGAGGWVTHGAASVVGAAVVAGGWISMAATAMASGIRMAAAWVIGLGPVAWIIAAIVAVGAGFVWLYNNVGWFKDGVDWLWKGFSNSFVSVWNFIIQPVLKFLVAGLVGVMDMFGNMFLVLGKVPGFGWATDAGNKIKGAADQVRGFSDSIKQIPPSKAVQIQVSATYDASVAKIMVAAKGTVRIAGLAEGGTVLPTPGGTIVRVAEAGRPESVVDTGKLNALLDRSLSGTSGSAMNGPVMINLYDANNVLLGTMRGVAGQESARIQNARDRGRR